MQALPRIALTLGDVAGIGPEVVARALLEASITGWCRPVVVGHPEVLRRAARAVGGELRVRPIAGLDEAFAGEHSIDCWNPAGDEAAQVPAGRNDARAGRAACDWLVAAARAALDKKIDAIVTAPLSKAALHLAGFDDPGHTEILAKLCGVHDYAMMLYLPAVAVPPGHEHQLGVAHVTLHTSIRSVPDLITTAGVLEKIRLLDRFLKNLGAKHLPSTPTSRTPDLTSPSASTSSDLPSPPGRGAGGVAGQVFQPALPLEKQAVWKPAPRVGEPAVPGFQPNAAPRIAVCALNPHAGEEGLFGNEEAEKIAPAVAAAAAEGVNVVGPIPADTLFRRAVQGEFEGVVAMYHDQGHIALKLVGREKAVNVTLGLPIVRTSPSHGTAFDIAWRGVARADGMIEAIRLAALLASGRG